MGKYFGTDGYRGEANVNLTAEHAFSIGRFLGWYFQKDKTQGRARIVIGKDTRRSGYMFEYALVGGIVASGADAYLLHVTTTPSVAFITKQDGFDCGIMISASHNPYFDNGIKLFNANGEKMEEGLILQLEAYLDSSNPYLPYAKREKIGEAVDYVAGRNRYVGYLISLGKFSFKGWRVGLDCANGSAWKIAKAVFEALGATTYLIGAAPNGSNINDGVGSTNIGALQAFVKEKGLDIGFAYDGDADRCLCVDENGVVADGDKILYAYATYLKERGELFQNAIVTTVMSNFGLYKALEKAGIGYEKTAVGDKYVYERMREGGFVLGGEQSGHIIFSKYATTGDGVLTSLQVMQMMLEKKQALSKLVAPMQAYPQVLINVRVKDKTAAMADIDVVAAVQEAEKRLGEQGRILVRESGTEPVIRVMAEGEKEEFCKELAQSVVDVLKAKGHAVE